MAKVDCGQTLKDSIRLSRCRGGCVNLHFGPAMVRMKPQEFSQFVGMLNVALTTLNADAKKSVSGGVRWDA